MKSIVLFAIATSTAVMYLVLKVMLATLGATHVILPLAVIGIIITVVCYYQYRKTMS